MEPRDLRQRALLDWLKANDIHILSMQPMPQDASFRRYFRIQTKNGFFVAMDAPPPQEDCYPFIAIANALRKRGVLVPEIFVADIKQGFLLISDFGEFTYLKVLTKHNADALYKNALQSLTLIQSCRDVPDVSAFDSTLMWQEWLNCKKWFLNKFLNLSPPAREIDYCYQLIIAEALNQPQVFMHRDYHSANLMMIQNAVGVLDFQDALMGPVTYDLVSLLRDCYIDWPSAEVIRWAISYYQQLIQLGVLTNVQQADFLRWFDFMGLQRHLKAIFIFARKYLRDQNKRYLSYMPRTLNYLLTISKRYQECKDLYDYLRDAVQPSCEHRLSLCAA